MKVAYLNHRSTAKHLKNEALFAAAAYLAKRARRQQPRWQLNQPEMAIELLESAAQEIKIGIGAFPEPKRFTAAEWENDCAKSMTDPPMKLPDFTEAEHAQIFAVTQLFRTRIMEASKPKLPSKS